MGNLDDFSLMLTKAYKAGFFEDIKPHEEAWLRQEAINLFSDDIALSSLFALKSEIGDMIGTNGIGEYQWVYPQAIYINTPSPQTLVSFVSGNIGGGNAQVGVMVHDHLTRKVKRIVVGTAPVDDHNVPSVAKLADGRIVISWTDHNVNNNVYLRVTNTSGDLSTLGPLQTQNIGGLASYTQIHPDPADPSGFFILIRRWVGAQPYDWIIPKVSISQSGTANWSSLTSLLLSTVSPIRQPYITSVPSTIGTDAGIRIALTDNPTNGSNVVHYGTINLVTGSVESPEKTIAANILTGSGLPLAFEAFNQAFTAGIGKELRVFAVKSGDKPAILCASGDAAVFDSDATYHQVAYSSSSDPGLKVTSLSSYVSTPSTNVFNVPSVKIRWYGTPTTYAEAKGLVRKYVTTGEQRSYQFRTISTGALRFIWYPTGTSTNVTVDSSVVPSTSAIGFGVDFNPNTGSGYEVLFWETLDGTVWTQVGTTKTGTSSTYFVGTAPVEIGESTASTRGTIRKVEFYASSGSSTVIAGPNFTDINQWADGDGNGTSRSDSFGNIWTLTGTAVVEGNGWAKTDFGLSGQSVDGAVHSYVSGMAYPIPSRGDVIYIGRENAGTWSIEKWSRGSGTWTLSETIVSSTLKKLIRPIPALNGGPYDITYSAVSNYSGYNNYQSDILGI